MCCNTTCTGTCQACTAAKKGSGSDGTCGAIALGSDPDNECADQGAASCGTSGACNGAGACSTYAAGTVCRPAAGACDVAEACPGGGVACPADSFEPSTVQCGSPAGACGLQPTCTGTSATCPAGGFVKAGTVCGAASGVCGTAPECTGASATCPAGGFLPATTVCRASAGPCDIAESCTGSSASCPANGFEPSGTACAASCASGELTSGGTCDGTDAACPTTQTVAPCPGNFECASATACKTTCTTPGDCTTNDCDTSKGVCETLVNGSDCTNNMQCTGTFCYVTGGGAGQETCHSDECSDGIQDGNETGIDCGGGTCGTCPDSDGCATATDCTSGFCESSVCTACATNANCTGDATTPTCNTTTGVCVQCVANTDCATPPNACYPDNDHLYANPGVCGSSNTCTYGEGTMCANGCYNAACNTSSAAYVGDAQPDPMSSGVVIGRTDNSTTGSAPSGAPVYVDLFVQPPNALNSLPQLTYTTNNFATTANVSCTPKSVSGGVETFLCTIPAQPVSTSVQFYLEITAWGGTNIFEPGNSVNYRYTTQ